jgi:hypothetical protein
MINRRPIGSRHTGQVEINCRRCKLGEVVLRTRPIEQADAGIHQVIEMMQ